MTTAQTLIDPNQRARAWGRVDRLVTKAAAAVPLLWGRAANVRSRDVQGVSNRSLATWHLSFTAIR